MTSVTKSISRAAVVRIYEALADIKGSFESVSHRWTAVAIRREFADVVEPILEMRNDLESRRPIKYLETRENLAREYSVKDSEGRPVVAQAQYVLDPARREEFNTKAQALLDENKDELVAFDSEVKKLNEFFNAKIDVTFPAMHMKVSWFKDDTKQENIEALFDLIDNDV